MGQRPRRRLCYAPQSCGQPQPKMTACEPRGWSQDPDPGRVLRGPARFTISPCDGQGQRPRDTRGRMYRRGVGKSWAWAGPGLCPWAYETRGCVLHGGRECRKGGQMGESYIPGHLPWDFLHTMGHPGLEALPTQEPVTGRGLSKAVGMGGCPVLGVSWTRVCNAAGAQRG